MLSLALLTLVGAACAQSPSRVEVESDTAGPVAAVEVAGDLEHPWGLAFLPDGRLLVTERAGRLRVVDVNGDPAVAPPTVEGTPAVYGRGQGGLLDVALAPDFAESALVYLTYAKPGQGGTAATALGRGRFEDGLDGPVLADFEELWEQRPFLVGPNHFGGRIQFVDTGHVLVTTGERFQFDPAQDLENTLGAIVRLNPDGSVPKDNPFVDVPGALPEIWSYGHRNVQSIAVDPATGTLWEAEFGPLGGDELNVIERGANYGWPAVSWGRNYDGSPIPDPPTRPEFTDAVRQWTPVISPSGMTFYTGRVFSAWTGSLFVSSLSQQGLVRLEINGAEVTAEELIPLDARIRDVAEGPDGFLYVAVDDGNGAVWRIEPETVN